MPRKLKLAMCRNPLYKHATPDYLQNPDHCPYDRHGRSLLEAAAEVPSHPTCPFLTPASIRPRLFIIRE